jgi:hypothetical protein
VTRTQTLSGPIVVTAVDTNDPRDRAYVPNRYEPGAAKTFER